MDSERVWNWCSLSPSLSLPPFFVCSIAKVLGWVKTLVGVIIFWFGWASRCVRPTLIWPVRWKKKSYVVAPLRALLHAHKIYSERIQKFTSPDDPGNCNLPDIFWIIFFVHIAFSLLCCLWNAPYFCFCFYFFEKSLPLSL